MFLEEHNNVAEVTRVTSATRVTVSYRSTKHRFFEPVPTACFCRPRGRFVHLRMVSRVVRYPGVPGVAWYHGTRGTMVHLPYHPRWQYTTLPGSLGPRDPCPSLCPTEAGSRKTTRNRHFLVTFRAFPGRPPNQTESLFLLFPEKTDPAPNQMKSNGIRKSRFLGTQVPRNTCFLDS